MATTFINVERGQKEIRRDWPNEEGLEAGEQTQEGRTSNLVIEKGTRVRTRRLELL